MMMLMIIAEFRSWQFVLALMGVLAATCCHTVRANESTANVEVRVCQCFCLSNAAMQCIGQTYTITLGMASDGDGDVRWRCPMSGNVWE